MFAIGHVEADLLVSNAGSRHRPTASFFSFSQPSYASAEPAPPVARRLRRLRRLRLLTTGQDDRRYTGQDDCRRPAETIRDALIGNYQAEHVFELTQAVALYDFYQTQVAQCDERIELALKQLQANVEPVTAPLPAARHRTKQPNSFGFDVRAALYGMLGVDLTQIHGLGPYVALKLVAECGNDMSRWPTAKHFTSWLCLAPGNKISGGKILSSKTRRSSSNVAAALRLAAVTIGRTDTALGGFYRRLSARIGKAKAVTATARKIAVLFYNTLRYGMEYVDPGAAYYEERYRQRVLNNLTRRAESLGYTLQVKTAT
jgi:transposase